MNTNTGIGGGVSLETPGAPHEIPAGPGGAAIEAEVVRETAAPLPQAPVGAGAVGATAQPGATVPPPVNIQVNLPMGARLRVVAKAIQSNWWRTIAVTMMVAAVLFFFMWVAAAGTGIAAADKYIEKDNNVSQIESELRAKQAEADRAWKLAYENANKPWWKRLNKWW